MQARPGRIEARVERLWRLAEGRLQRGEISGLSDQSAPVQFIQDVLAWSIDVFSHPADLSVSKISAGGWP